MKGLFQRAFLVCSTNKALKKEISYLKRVFIKTNGYPSKIVNNTLHEVRQKYSKDEQSNDSIETTDNHSDKEELELKPFICLPYRGCAGEKLIKGFKKELREILPQNFKPRFTYKGTKLGSFFSVKDKVEKIHQTNLVYGYIPRDGSKISDGYVGETRVRFERRTHEHAKIDKESAIFKNSKAKNIEVSANDFQILEKGFSKSFDRKIAEALYIKQLNPVLNEQKDSFKLKLFN